MVPYAFTWVGVSLALLGASAVAHAEPAVPLTLERAETLALERNPALAARSRAVEAEEAGVRQAALTPNPRLEATLEDVAGSSAFAGARRAESTIRVAKLVELGGKRQSRTEAAASGADLARAELDAERAELRAEVAKRFGHVLADQAEVALRAEAMRIGRRALATVESQSRAGRLSEMDERKARILVARGRIAEEHAGHELRSARRRLAALWDEAEPSFAEASGDLFDRAPLLELDEILDAVGAAPAIRRADAAIARRKAEIAVAQGRGIPDLDLAAGPRRYEAEDEIAFVFGVAIPIPIFDRNQGGIAEARARLDEAEAARRGAESQLRAELYGAYQELRHADTELQTLDREIMPDATETLRHAERGFDLGRLSYLELLDAHRTWVEVAEQRIEAARERWRQRARLARLMGERS